MPCSETHGLVKIVMDIENNFLSFDYTKYTCGRSIGSHKDIEVFLQGSPVSRLIEMSFFDFPFASKLPSRNAFLIYAQWKALVLSLKVYLGLLQSGDACELISLDYSDKDIFLQTKILPLVDQPKVESCLSRERKTAL